MKEHKQDARLARIRQRIQELTHALNKSSTDVNGSYTGTPQDGGEPVQDADDL